MSEWQPIETAPDDGRAFLAINKYDCQWICTKMDGRIIGIGEATCDAAAGVARLATHWRPLPPPAQGGRMTMGKENPFKIDIARNEQMGSWDVLLQVGGLASEKQAKQFADILAEWMTAESGWVAKVQ